MLTLNNPQIILANEETYSYRIPVPFASLYSVASEIGDRTIPADVAQLSDSLKRQYAPDKRVALFDVDYSFSGKNVMLRGVTTSAEAKAALLNGLSKADYQVMDCLQVLPDEAALEGKLMVS